MLEQRLDAPSSAKEAMGLLKQQEHGKGEGLAALSSSGYKMA